MKRPPGKGSNCGGLAVINSVSRLYSKIIKQQIGNMILDVKEQNVFRAYLTIFYLKQILEKQRKRILESYLVFII